ncbi:Uncharacterised protein [Vibrio cholerae]|nr:Uncharacterised protein [Vibrio cholerae]
MLKSSMTEQSFCPHRCTDVVAHPNNFAHSEFRAQPLGRCAPWLALFPQGSVPRPIPQKA